MQIPTSRSEDSGADAEVRFRRLGEILDWRVPVQIPR